MSTACFDLDAFVSEESGSSQGYSQTSMGGTDRESVSSGTSSADEQSDLSCELSHFQPLNSPVSPISDIGSQIVVKSHLTMRRRICPEPLCTSGATDVFPIYQVSPGNTGYLPAMSPVTPPIPDCFRFLQVRTFCHQERLGRSTASLD